VTDPKNGAEKRVTSVFWNPLQNLTFIVGMVLAGIFLWHLVLVLSNGDGTRCGGWFSSWVVTSNTRGEYRLKQAASRKLNTMLMNAHSLHQPGTSRRISAKPRARMSVSAATDQTMLNFVLRGQREENAGGFLWTFRLVFSGELFDTEGIWLPTRLLVFQGAQVVIAAFLSFGFIYITKESIKSAEEAQADLDDDLPGWVLAIVPTPTDVKIALYPATAVAMIVMLVLIFIYIPR
jgi:hypothetical protein